MCEEVNLYCPACEASRTYDADVVENEMEVICLACGAKISITLQVVCPRCGGKGFHKEDSENRCKIDVEEGTEMFLEIETLTGEIMRVELSEVGPCYPDDDVIYFSGVPCRLSSARPTLQVEADQEKPPTV